LPACGERHAQARRIVFDRSEDFEAEKYLLTNEYDLSATPALTAELARLVKARHFEEMEGLGHLPMSENPRQFRRYFLPVLAHCYARGGLTVRGSRSSRTRPSGRS
jgi:pimeloyl-ACP methyl ester carboxylesterase